MTVASAVSRKTFTGDDATTAFATTPVVFFDETDLLVYVITTATGAAELQSLTTDYTVTGGAGSTGTVTMLTAPASTETLLIKRVMPITQATDFVNNDASDAETAEDSLDKLTMIAQQLASGAVSGGYGLRLPELETPTDALTILPFDRASTVLGFDASKNLTTYDASSAVTEASNVTFLQSGTGASATDIQTRGRLIVFANDFGTKLATTPAADINLAISAVNTAGSGTVLIPAGTHQIETAILHKSNVKLQGYGVGVTILQQKSGYNGDVINQATATASQSVTSITHSSGTATVTITGHGYAVGDIVFIMGADQRDYLGAFEVLTTPTADTFTIKVSKDATSPATGTITCYEATNSDIAVERLTILGASGASGGKGIEYEGIHRFRIKDVEVRDTNEHGIAVLSGYKGSITNCGAHGVVTSTHIGILLGASSSPATFACGIDVVGCKTSANGQDGILAEQGRDISIVGCYAWRNSQSGIKVGKAQRVTVSANNSWGNTNGIHAQGPWANIAIVGNTSCLNGDSGILVSQTSTTISNKQISVVGNICDDNGQVGSATQYGIAFESISSATIDTVAVVGNVCSNQTRGISFGTSGTISNVLLASNTCKNNTVDFNAGASLQTATLIKGFNIGTAGSGSNALTYATQIHRLNFSVDNLAQNATTALTIHGAGARGFVMPEAGYIRRMYVKGNAACTQGSCTFQLLKNTVANTNFNCVIDTTDTTTDTATQAVFNQTFAAGDLITAQAVAGATFEPTGTTDYDLVIEVVY